MLLAGCATSAEPPAPKVMAPVPPAWLAPVAMPEVRSRDDARVLLGAHRKALAEANARLAKGREWVLEIGADRK